MLEGTETVENDVVVVSPLISLTNDLTVRLRAVETRT